MPSGVYTTRFAAFLLTDGVTTETTEVPVDRRWVVRDMQLVNSESTPVRLIVYLVTGSLLKVFWDGEFTQRQVQRFELRQVLEWGEKLRFLALGGQMWVYVTGYDFGTSS